MRVRSWLGVFASFLWFSACTLTTDLDNLSGGAASSDGGRGDGSSGGPGDAGSSGAPEGGVREGGSDAGPSYGELVMQDHPVAYFPFDEADGTNVFTEKISGQTSTAKKPDFAPGAPGIAGTALALTGHADMDFGDRLDFTGKNPWSIEAWIKPALEDGKVFYEYFNKRDNGNNGIVTYVRHENGELTVQVEQSYPSGGGRGVSAELPGLGHFIHIVFVYDPGKTGIRVWVDGVHGDRGYDDNGGPTDNPQSVYIASGLKGVIDEMAVYDYALPDARVLAHFAAGKQP